jgi:hypothetical protein
MHGQHLFLALAAGHGDAPLVKSRIVVEVSFVEWTREGSFGIQSSWGGEPTRNRAT